jgi:hypothetical protein
MPYEIGVAVNLAPGAAFSHHNVAFFPPNAA